MIGIEDLSFRVQVKLFAEADFIIMPTGAAVTNSMWCRRGTQIIVLTSDHPAIQHNIWQIVVRSIRKRTHDCARRPGKQTCRRLWRA